jgi:hypothetical protein
MSGCHHKHRSKPIKHYHEHYWRESERERERERPLTYGMPCPVPVSGNCIMTPRGPICVISPGMRCDD